MVSDRRRGGEKSGTRAALVQAAEELIREQGYPAVTTRNLAQRLNLKRQIVHYYFHTMDDLFIAVVRRNAEQVRERLASAANSSEPLRVLQELNRDSSQAILATELYALANRRPAVRAEVVRTSEEMRALQTRIMADHLKARGITPLMPPVVATVLLTSLAQILALEAAIQIGEGHEETLAFVDASLRAFAEGRDAFPSSAQTTPSAASAREA